MFSSTKMSFAINDNPLKNFVVPLQEITSYDDDNDDNCNDDNDGNDENKRNLFDELF